VQAQRKPREILRKRPARMRRIVIADDAALAAVSMSVNALLPRRRHR
jgi:hypothetical protein